MKGDDFPGQFLLDDQPFSPPEGWVSREVKEWRLFADARLPIIDMLDRNSTWFGWILGFPVRSREATLVADQITFPIEHSTVTLEELESILYELGGRWIALWMRPYPRLFLDPSGSLAAFYDATHRRVASSPELLAMEGVPVDATLGEIIDEAKRTSGTWYPAGLTKFPSVRVLLPNHLLDLTLWQAIRHWPKVPQLPENTDVPSALREIADLIASNIRAFARQYSLQIALTAGQDSRMLLACAGDLASRIRFYTTDQPGWDNSTPDRVIARLIARLYHLDYSILDHSNEGALPGCAIVLGFGGEVARSFYWRPKDGNSRRRSPDDLLDRLQYGTNDALRTAMSDWMASVSHYDFFTMLDLLYIEHRLGTCMGHVLYSYDRSAYPSMYPINHRRIFTLMLSLPKWYRRRKRLGIDISTQLRPELAYIPFNDIQFRGLQKYRKRLSADRLRRLVPDDANRKMLMDIIMQGTPLYRWILGDALFAIKVGLPTLLGRIWRKAGRVMRSLTNHAH